MTDPDFAFPETARSLPIVLLQAREQVMERFRPLLRAIDVTEAQWRVLRVAQERGTTEAAALGQAACILAPSLTRVLRALERRGLITVTKSTRDRRRLMISLTSAGTDLLSKVALQNAAIHAALRADLGVETLETLLNALNAVNVKLHHAPQR